MGFTADGSFHFCSPDGTSAITLKPGEVRTTSNMLIAEFASRIAKGEVNGIISGNTISLGSAPAVAEEQVEESELEEDIVEESDQIVPETSDRAQVILSAVSELYGLGDPELMTATGEPRLSEVRLRSFSDVTADERDAAVLMYNDG